MRTVADLFGFIPRAIEWLGERLGWVGDAVEWVGDEFAWIADVLTWLGDALALAGPWIGEKIAWLWNADFPISSAVRAGAVIVVVAIGLALAIRKLRLRRLARSPRVQVTPFTWTGPSEGERTATWVASLFRERLTGLQLDALDALPERAPGAPLVEIVEGVSQGVSQKVDVGKALARSWRAIWPNAAYEVWGTLRPLDGKGRISVQLVDRARGNRILLSEALDKVEWEQAAKEAAMAVAGALYPNVDRRYRGPWTGWNEAVPRELIGAYHRAHELEDESRLEEAMDAYHAALGDDPLNPDLRLRIAMLQERLGLSLDAWVTYRAIIDETERSAWRGPDRRTRFLALFRLAVLLGNGQMAEQWVKDCAPDSLAPTERDEEMWALRFELTTTLERDLMLVDKSLDHRHIARRRVSIASATELFDALRGDGPRTRAERREWIRSSFLTETLSDDGPEERRRERIEEVLQLMSLRRLEEVDAWLRARAPLHELRDWWLHRPPPSMWLRRRDFSPSAIRVSKRLARLRIAASEERRLARSGASVEKVRREHRRLASGWPFPSQGAVRGLARKIAPRRRWANRREDAWQLHYNAACAVATVLLDDSVLRKARKELEATPELEAERHHRLPREWREKWPLPSRITFDVVVKRAVEELEEYAHRAGTNRVARQADWIAFDDPDLVGIARTEEFKLWASHHLPMRLPEERPDRTIDVDRYTAQLVRHGALSFAEIWRERAEMSDTAAKAVAAWWRRERYAWGMLAEVCREHHSWQRRLEALQALERWQETGEGSRPIDLRHEPRGPGVASRLVSADLFERIAGLAGDGAAPGAPDNSSPPTVMDWVSQRAEKVHAAHQAGARRLGDGILRSEEERAEALRAARIWAAVAEALDVELNGGNGERGSASIPNTIEAELLVTTATPGRVESLREAVARWIAP